MNIGLQIRNLRLQNQLTQKELALNISVTSGYISQIENNLISPSLKILFKLCDLFKISVSDFFKHKTNLELIHKKEDFLKIPDKSLQNTSYHFFPNLVQNKIQVIIVEIEPQGQTKITNQSITEEFSFLLEGEMILFINKVQYLLKKEDAFYLSTDKEYYCFNHTNHIVRLLTVITSRYYEEEN
ncbi:helix-turn-helix domain-containing protein [Candidatus Phytoplasma phoenicium]|uniref:Cro/Cl family transcriptional regulator n=1 Tax=Candidatus Phytoplasma phoenicium TaxID=198422 RepID=A0A0L0MK54_9MOLU|nr:helix-turn-helix domain-containing protein [Candidatus Phytoplasma phoenicium]KND62631.1 Cro/Cl family transcriptional regulator [Candidatus Phytoplasma phoenicium]